MKIKAIIVEDEEPARELLKRNLSKYDFIEVIDEAVNGREAVLKVDSKKPDLIFLDIEIPVFNGIEVLERLVHKPAVVFITAYDDYAIKAFEVNAFDYLLKPYSEERLARTIEKVYSGLKRNDSNGRDYSQLIRYYREGKKYLDRLTIRNKFEYKVFNVDSIDFFRAEDKLVFMYIGNVKYLVDIPLSRLEERLNPEHFFRVHRNAIVNLDKIERILPWGRGKYVVQFASGERIRISRERVQEFKILMGLKL